MAVGWTSKVVASAQTALWREGSGIDFWMPKNIHSLLLAQLSIRLFHPHCFHLSAPFISSYIYLIIFSSLFFFDSLSVSLPSRPFSGFPLRLMFFLPFKRPNERQAQRLAGGRGSVTQWEQRAVRVHLFPRTDQRGCLPWRWTRWSSVNLGLTVEVLWGFGSRWQRIDSPSGTVSFCRPTNLLPHPELSFRLGLSSSCHPSRHRLIKPSRPPHKRRGGFLFFLKGGYMQDSWAKKADRAFAACHSEWAFIFSCTANPLWSGKPPETFWSNSWLEGASLKIEPFRSFQL